MPPPFCGAVAERRRSTVTQVRRDRAVAARASLSTVAGAFPALAARAAALGDVGREVAGQSAAAAVPVAPRPAVEAAAAAARRSAARASASRSPGGGGGGGGEGTRRSGRGRTGGLTPAAAALRASRLRGGSGVACGDGTRRNDGCGLLASSGRPDLRSSGSGEPIATARRRAGAATARAPPRSGDERGRLRVRGRDRTRTSRPLPPRIRRPCASALAGRQQARELGPARPA